MSNQNGITVDELLALIQEHKIPGNAPVLVDHPLLHDDEERWDEPATGASARIFTTGAGELVIHLP